MKFKKIEISAFRIYDNPDNAIFDLTSNLGEPADFVSLYAPNGFGKTSFYDAVEWGVTGSVNRFFIRNKELNKLEQNQLSHNQIPLLRNSNLERDTYVKIESDLNKVEYENSLPKESVKSDLVLKNDAEPHEFHKVILSQEWISAFLTETDGEDRYRKFMEIPELSSINEYYINLKHLLSVQGAEEKRINTEIEWLEKQIKNLEDQNLLEIINQRIENINKLCDEKIFDSISIETTDAELVTFKDLVATKQTQYNKEILTLTNKIDNLRIAITGSNEIPSLKCFSDNKASFPKLLSEIDEIKQLVTKFNEMEKISNELMNLTQSLSQISSQKLEIEIVLKKYNNFESINSEIKTKEEEFNKLQISLPELKEEIDKLKSEELLIKEKLKSCLQQIEVNEGKKRDLPTFIKNIGDVTNGINETNEWVEAETSKIGPLEKLIKEKTKRLLELETLQNQLKEGKYSKKYLEEKPELIKLVDVLSQSLITVSKEKSKLDTLNKKIEEQQDLNSSIQNFIEQGLSIVNEQQTSKCPLCEHQYPDLTTLADRISKNNALSDILKGYSSQKQIIMESIKNIEESINNGNQMIIDYYTSKINEIATDVLTNSEAINEFKQHIQEGSDKLKNLKDKNAEMNASMLGMTVDEYTQNLEDLILSGEKSKVTITKSLTDLSVDVKNKQELLEIKHGESALIQEKIEELQKNTDYVVIADFIKVNYPSKDINKSFLDDLIKNYEKDILTTTEKIKHNEDLLNELNEKLSMHNKENLKNKESELEFKKVNLENELNKYILFFKENFNHEIDDLNTVEINQFIENEKTKCTPSLNKYNSINDELTMLEKNSLHISDFLQSEKTKSQIQSNKEKYSFLTKTVRPIIEAERNNTKQFIEEQITNFLQEELIGKLYNKIDPHPEFKNVKFKPNLEVEPPRLDVFVENKDSEFIIPNLYFSTAQINVLSLCIFLASALKSKEYDCVFIDDPIQSMDSINILSTIDLLRSIVVNNDKQIIISTHDENFHNLLKKKMPAEFFKSKFLKLESFGRVVNDV